MALTQCPDCGSDVSTEAPACPKCGRPITPQKQQRKTSPLASGCLVVILIVVGGALLKGFFSGSNPSSSSRNSNVTSGESGSTAQTADESRPIQTYTAEQLYAMFHANEVKANKTIGNAIVRFTGTIASIQKSDFSNTPELQIRGSCFDPSDCQDPDSWNTFEADLRSSELSAAAALVKGQTITLQCNKVRMPLDVYAQGCVIVPEDNRSNSAD